MIHQIAVPLQNAQRRQRLDREASHRRSSRGITLDEVARQISEGQVRRLGIIIKADQAGPAEALADAFAQLSTDEVAVDVIHRGVGAITASDVMLATASNAIVVGFHVRPDGNARSAAERENVDIRTYRVIYEAVEDVRAALEGLLPPEEREVVLGEAEVLQIFKISGIGTIAGCMIRHGLIRRSARVRVVRDGVEIYSGVMASLKRFKDDVREVKEGLECGIGVENFNDIKVRDILEAYEVEEVARTLELMAAGKIDPSCLITQRVNHAQAERAYDLLSSDRSQLAILLEYPQDLPRGLPGSQSGRVLMLHSRWIAASLQIRNGRRRLTLHTHRCSLLTVILILDYLGEC